MTEAPSFDAKEAPFGVAVTAALWLVAQQHSPASSMRASQDSLGTPLSSAPPSRGVGESGESERVPKPARRAAPSRYEIVRRLGGSATSESLLAIARGPLGFERHVVLKRLLRGPSGLSTPASEAALGREALAYARVSHPAVVRLYDFVEEDGRLTLVLEHVDGTSLAKLLSTLRSFGESLDDTCALYIGYRLLSAVAAAHGAREPLSREFAPVIHRALSPSNVLVGWDGDVKLTDFGLASLGGVRGGAPPSLVRGNVGYLAPEQAKGETVTVRSDVYAACLVVRELLTNAPVFPRRDRSEGELLAEMAEPNLSPTAAACPRLSPWVAEALDRGLAVDPEQRNVTADELSVIVRRAIEANVGSVDDARVRFTSRIASIRRSDETMRLVADTFDASEADDAADTVETLPEVAASVADVWLDDDETAVLAESRPAVPAIEPAARTERLPAIEPATEPPVQTVSMVVPAARRVAPPPIPSPLVAQTLPMRPTGTGALPSNPAFEASHPLPDTRTKTPATFIADVASSSAGREPTNGRSIVLAAAVIAVVVGALTGGGLAFRDRVLTRWSPSAAPSSKPVAAVPTPSVAPAPPPTLAPAASASAVLAVASPSALASSSAAKPISSAPVMVPEGAGRLLTDTADAGHRIFVDGKLAGSSGKPVVVACGSHQVRLGSAGRLQTLDVPCGGDVTLAR